MAAECGMDTPEIFTDKTYQDSKEIGLYTSQVCVCVCVRACVRVCVSVEVFMKCNLSCLQGPSFFSKMFPHHLASFLPNLIVTFC